MARTAADRISHIAVARWGATRDAARVGSTAFDRYLLSRLDRPFRDTPIHLQLWDGTAVGPPPPAAAATVIIRNRFMLLALAADPEMAFGDGYASGAIDVEGDLAAVLEAAYQAFPCAPAAEASPRGHAGDVLAGPNARHHYDVGNDFYALWLDDAMVYTCAYFPHRAATLEEAQRAKLEYVCRKLHLRAGERVIEAGCGWGALALHLAQHHGVRVTAYNVSHEQTVYARAQAQRLGLQDRVEFVEDDFRNARGPCDAFVSLGMVEHLGATHLAELGRVVDNVLDKRAGRGLLHFIGRNAPRTLSPWIRRRIFPGSYLPALAEALREICEPWNLSVLDVENLRLHYALTLQHWRERYEAAADRVAARYGEQFARAWRLYLAGSLVAFRGGTLQLFQVTFARGSSNDLPWTRAALYHDREAAS